MTTKPKDLMTLEAVQARLSLSLEHRCFGFPLTAEEVVLFESILHHLKVGRKAQERLQFLASNLGARANQTPPYVKCFAVWDANKTLHEAIDDGISALSAREVKETICPGCGKPSNHMEGGTTSDHWGVWHSECEKDFWMAGSGLDDEVPPFSRRKQP